MPEAFLAATALCGLSTFPIWIVSPRWYRTANSTCAHSAQLATPPRLTEGELLEHVKAGEAKAKPEVLEISSWTILSGRCSSTRLLRCYIRLIANLLDAKAPGALVTSLIESSLGNVYVNCRPTLYYGKDVNSQLSLPILDHLLVPSVHRRDYPVGHHFVMSSWTKLKPDDVQNMSLRGSKLKQVCIGSGSYLY